MKLIEYVILKQMTGKINMLSDCTGHVSKHFTVKSPEFPADPDFQSELKHLRRSAGLAMGAVAQRANPSALHFDICPLRVRRKSKNRSFGAYVLRDVLRVKD